MVRIYPFVILLVFVLASCQSPKRSPFLVIDLDGDYEQPLFLSYLDTAFTRIDSVNRNEDGTWMFYNDSIAEGFYRLEFADCSYLNLILRKGMPVTIEGDAHRIKETAIIHGSNASQGLLETERIVGNLQDDIRQATTSFLSDSLSAADFITRRDSTIRFVESRKLETRKQLMAIVEKEADDILLGMTILLQVAGNHAIFSPELDFELYKDVDSKLFKQFSGYPPVVKFHKDVQELEQWVTFTSLSAPGKMMPEPQVPNAWNEPLPISQFRGKPLLVIVWASDSEDSRIFNKELVNLVRPYKSRGMEVYMISLDKDVADWKAAIKDDRLAFWHVSDLKGDSSQAVKQLGIDKVPMTYLVDKKGVIAGRDLWGAELRMELDNLIKN
ncbi:TlpA family protein disulfide reductase [Marinilabiliaceae bacterium JC017]|nr:TlpA family protein disulfide reductase [Marinilabiliaceae bacterium JC017]